MTAAERRFKDRKTFEDARVLHMFEDALLVHIEVSAACVRGSETKTRRGGSESAVPPLLRCKATRSEGQGSDVKHIHRHKLFARSKPCVPKGKNAKRQCRSPQSESAHSNSIPISDSRMAPCPKQLPAGTT